MQEHTGQFSTAYGEKKSSTAVVQQRKTSNIQLGMVHIDYK